MDAASAAAPFPVEGGSRLAVWATEVFFHNKCRTLFSMLFGISIYLVGGERSDRAREALLRRRLLFLALFGLIHGLALWFGDILLLYAWSGLFMLLARSWPPRKLFWVGAVLVAAFSVLSIMGESLAILMRPPFDAVSYAEGIQKGREETLATVAAVRSGWVGAMVENIKMWGLVQAGSAIAYVVPTVGLMMLGLGLFKTGYLAGRASDRTYGVVLVVGLAITAALGSVRWLVLAPGPASDLVAIADAVLGELAPVVTLAGVGLLVLMTRHGLGPVTRRLAPVGRMAFTNYLSQSLIMATIFYMPWGPHLYGRVEPAGLWAWVAGVWVLQLVWSPLWLSRFEMGPLEWVWRCLTYGRRVPLLKAG